MRTINFRVWDRLAKRMIPENDQLFSQQKFESNEAGKMYQFRIDYRAEFFKEIQKTYDLMQFTGLLDKNGKEIYEGDIVVLPRRYPFFDYPEGAEKDLDGGLLKGKVIPNYRGVVEWVYSQWQVVLNCVNPAKSGVSDGINGGLNDDGFAEGKKTKWEAIGNIYENPELIKKLEQ